MVSTNGGTAGECEGPRTRGRKRTAAETEDLFIRQARMRNVNGPNDIILTRTIFKTEVKEEAQERHHENESFGSPSANRPQASTASTNIPDDSVIKMEEASGSVSSVNMLQEEAQILNDEHNVHLLCEEEVFKFSVVSVELDGGGSPVQNEDFLNSPRLEDVNSQLNKMLKDLNVKDLKILDLEQQIEVQHRELQEFAMLPSRDEMAKKLIEMRQVLKRKDQSIQELNLQLNDTEEALQEKNLKIELLEKEVVAYQKKLQESSTLPCRDDELCETRRVLKAKESSKTEQMEQEFKTRLNELRQALIGKDLKIEQLKHQGETKEEKLLGLWIEQQEKVMEEMKQGLERFV